MLAGVPRGFGTTPPPTQSPTWVHGKGVHGRALLAHAPRQLQSKQRVAQLGLAVGGPRAVAARLPVQVVQGQPLCKVVAKGGERHDAAARRRHLGQQQRGQAVVPHMAHAPLRLEPLLRQLLGGQPHDACGGKGRGSGAGAAGGARQEAIACPTCAHVRMREQRGRQQLPQPRPACQAAATAAAGAAWQGQQRTRIQHEVVDGRQAGHSGVRRKRRHRVQVIQRQRRDGDAAWGGGPWRKRHLEAGSDGVCHALPRLGAARGQHDVAARARQHAHGFGAQACAQGTALQRAVSSATNHWLACWASVEQRALRRSRRRRRRTRVAAGDHGLLAGQVRAAERLRGGTNCRWACGEPASSLPVWGPSRENPWPLQETPLPPIRPPLTSSAVV